MNCTTPGCGHAVYQHRSTYRDNAGVMRGWSCVMFGCRCETYTAPETEAFHLGFERGYINAPRSEGSEYGGGWYTDEWRRGWDAGYEQWDGKRGFRDVF